VKTLLKFDCLVKVNAQQFCETIDYCVVELNPMIFVFANGIWISATSLACFKSNGDQTARGEKPVARRQWLD
jgi:hypothetical protein